MRKQKEKKRKRKRRIDRNFYSRGENNKTNLKKDLTQPCPRPRPWIHGLLSLLPSALFIPRNWAYFSLAAIFGSMLSTTTSSRAFSLQKHQRARRPASGQHSLHSMLAPFFVSFLFSISFLKKINSFFFSFFFYVKGEKKKKGKHSFL